MMREHRTDCDESNCDRSCPFIPDNDHTRKYEALAQRIGVDALRALLSDKAERIRNARLAGDEHLNTINLAWWDRRAGSIGPAYGPNWPRLSWDFPWTKARAGALSLAERVCTLKHVATYHLDPASARREENT